MASVPNAAGGTSPVSAIFHVARTRSADQMVSVVPAMLPVNAAGPKLGFWSMLGVYCAVSVTVPVIGATFSEPEMPERMDGCCMRKYGGGVPESGNTPEVATHVPGHSQPPAAAVVILPLSP